MKEAVHSVLLQSIFAFFSHYMLCYDGTQFPVTGHCKVGIGHMAQWLKILMYNGQLMTF